LSTRHEQSIGAAAGKTYWSLIIFDFSFPFLRLTGFVEPNLLEPCKGWRAKMENEKWKMTDDQ